MGTPLPINPSERATRATCHGGAKGEAGSRGIPSANDHRPAHNLVPETSEDPSTRPFRLRALHFAATVRPSLGMTEERAAHVAARSGIPSYGTVADHAVVSPDSKPSKNTGPQQVEVALRMLKSEARYHIS